MKRYLLASIGCILYYTAISQCPISETNTNGSSLTGQFGQSFEPQCSGRVTSISFDALAASIPLVGTLEIFEGDGTGGTSIYSQSLSLAVAIGTNTINLDEPPEVLIKNTYTFELTLSVSVTIAKSSLNPYADGQMYLSGTAVSTDDLVFGVTMNEVYPAGVSTNLALWLKADANTNTTTNEAAVTSWNDVSSNENNYTGSGSNSVYNDSFVPERSSITFDANSAVLSTTDVTYTDATLYVVVNHSDNPGSNDFFGNIGSEQNLIRFEQTSNSNRYGYTVSSGTDYQSTLTSSHGSAKILTLETDNTASTMNIQDIINGTRRSNDFNVGATNRSLSIQDIGGFGDVAEIILYGGGTSSSGDRQKIESYLAIKYGLEYDMNLLASDNTVIWDRTANSAYSNNVSAIGRDDDGSVLIKKSISSASDAMVTMENTDVFSTDLSYIAWGHNNEAVHTPNNVDVDGTIIDTRLSRVWQVSETGTVGNVDVSIDLTDVPGAKTATDLRLLIDRDGDGFADNDVVPLTGSMAGNTFTVSDVDFQNGDRFTVGSTNSSQTPLPIQLVAFDASNNYGTVILTWKTASETNNNFFTLEKSYDGVNWKAFATIAGAGYSNQLLSYQHVDYLPHAPGTFYRLKQTDFDGQFEYFETKWVAVETQPLEVFPNPLTSELNVGNVPMGSIIILRSLNGQELFTSKMSDQFLNAVDVAMVPKGVYILEVFNNNRRLNSFRLVKK